MKSKVLKILCSIVAIVCLMSTVGLFSYASRENIISSPEIAAKPGDTIQVPVTISENTGIMGFSIVVEVDENFLEPVSVERGTVLAEGLFENSIGTSESNSNFKVIWCGTENMTENGVIFTMIFNVPENADGNTKIKISYDKEDTFDQDWNDKKLTCEEITVSVNADSEVRLTFLQRIKNMFVRIIEWLISLFN